MPSNLPHPDKHSSIFRDPSLQSATELELTSKRSFAANFNPLRGPLGSPATSNFSMKAPDMADELQTGTDFAGDGLERW